MATLEIPDLHPPDDYSHRFFIWHEWIQANGPLTEANVFDYFATSMFYDKQCNNQVLRMQTIFAGIPLVNEAEELRRFTGVEFAVVHAQPPSMFIIHKRERLSPDEVRPVAVYFIMNNRIYQAPDLYTVLSNRLLTSLNSLQTTLETLRRHRPDYLPRTGFIWPILDSSTSIDEASKRSRAGSVPAADSQEAPPLSLEKDTAFNSSDAQKKQQNSMLLLNAMRTTAEHSKSPLSIPVPMLEDIASPINLTQATSSSGPSQTSPGTPQIVGPEEPAVKVPVGLGKKKKKRTLPNPAVS